MSLAGGASRAVGSSTSHLPDALRVPPHVYYISTTNCQLIKYSLVTRVSSPLAVLPAESENGGVRMPRCANMCGPWFCQYFRPDDGTAF